ncbi:MAG TPA: zinc ribbon domain-containing protein [Chloroflexia bacterium]|nr:zinc ribbon domain-containing protein [Chloroflexia bacterium]
MRCPFCGVPNRPGMAFCYDCGESLDDTPPPGPVGVARPLPRPTRRPRASWELLLGLGLLLLIAVVAVVDGWQEAQRTEQAHFYRQGQDAQAAGDLVRAVAAYRQAGPYRDAPALYARLAPQVIALGTAYNAGVRLAQAGAWWDAAHALRQAADIQISYQDVLTRLHAALVQTGPLFYRAPAPDGTQALWWADADGRNVHRLPSGSASELVALSPDDRWAVYSYGPAATAGSDRDGPFLLDRTSGHLTSLGAKYMSVQGPLRVRFRGDSQGFWWSFDNQAFYYDLVAGHGGPLSDLPAAFDPGQGRLALNRFMAGDTSGLHSRLLLSDPWGQNRTPLVDAPGEFADVSFSDDGRYLLYTQIGPALPGPGGHLMVTNTLILRDLADLAAPPAVVYAGPTTVDGGPAAAVQGCFVPGTTHVLVLQTTPSQWRLWRWDAGRAAIPLAAGATQASPVTSGQLLAVPGGSWLAAGWPTPDGSTRLRLLSLAGGPPVEAGAAGRWWAFSPDGQLAVEAQPASNLRGGDRLASLASLVGLGGAQAGKPGAPFVPITLSPAPAGDGVAFTRDSSRLLVLNPPGQPPGLYALRLDGSDPVLITHAASAFWTGRPLARPLFSPPAAETKS